MVGVGLFRFSTASMAWCVWVVVCLGVSDVFGPSPASSRTRGYSVVYLCPKYLAQGLSVKIGSAPVSDVSKLMVVDHQEEAYAAQDFGLIC